MDWVQDIWRSLFINLDSVIYSFIYICYKIIMCLANLQIFSDETFADFAQRIYIFIGIFMLFRIGFSLLQYIVNPDVATDKNTGAGKMIKNCIFALILLVMTPWLFTQLYNLQSAILSEDVLGKLILGNNVGGGDDASKLTVNNAATNTQFLLFGAFFQVNPEALDKDEKPCENHTVLGSVSMGRDDTCTQAIDNAISSNNTTINDFFWTSSGTDTRNFSSFVDVVNVKSGDNYVFDYKYLISTIAGVVVVFMLITFCIDVAIRAIYLGFLQLISPIPIISYIIPRKGEEVFKSWVKEVGTTFLSLFIRLGAIYLAIYFIQIITDTIFVSADGLKYHDSDFCSDCGEMTVWIYVFLIIGAFLFAKKVPQYLETIFGFKSTGDMLKSPFKKMQESGFLTGATGMIGAGITGGIAGGYAASQVAKLNGQNKIAQGILGAGKGIVGGAWQGRSWDGKNAGDLIKTGFKTSGGIARYQSAKVGTTAGHRTGAIFRELTGAPPRSEITKGRLDAAKEFNDTFGRVDSALLTKLKKYGVGDTSNKITDENTYEQIRDYNKLRSRLEAARTSGDYDTIKAIEEGEYNQDGLDMKALAKTYHIEGGRFDDFEDNAKDVLYSAMKKTDDNGEDIVTHDDDIKRIIAETKSLETMYENNKDFEEFKGGVKFDGTFNELKDSNKEIETRRIQTEASDQYQDDKHTDETIKSSRMYNHFKS